MDKTTKPNETIKTMEHARSVINALQRRCDKACHEELLAKARLYDIQNFGFAEPNEAKLKAEIVSTRLELKKVIEQRDKLKQRIIELQHMDEERNHEEIS